MYLVFFLIIIGEFLIFFYNLNAWYFLSIIGTIVGLYKGIHSEEFKHIFNFHKIDFRLTKEHFLELILSLLVAILPFHTEILESDFKIIYFIEYIAFSLFFYRFLCFNLFQKQKNT